MTKSAPLTSDQKLTIKQLVDDGEIDAARKLLTKWGAVEPLAKLNARYPVASKPAPLPVVIVTPGATYRRVRNFVLFVLICILVVSVASYAANWQREYDAMYNQIEALR